MEGALIIGGSGTNEISTSQISSGSASAISVSATVTAGDTAYVNFIASGGTKTTTVLGTASPYKTYFSGHLVA